MILRRNETHLGHRANSIPRHFVCAECGDELVSTFLGKGNGDEVACKSDRKHTGFQRREDQAHAAASVVMEQQVQNIREAYKIAETSPEVAAMLRENRRKINQQLLGED